MKYLFVLGAASAITLNRTFYTDKTDTDSAVQQYSDARRGLLEQRKKENYAFEKQANTKFHFGYKSPYGYDDAYNS